ncbi:MAG: family 2A encapsulin nanocompartment cargo protein cysteine desulfurase [Caldilineaceae bacterium]
MTTPNLVSSASSIPNFGQPEAPVTANSSLADVAETVADQATGIPNPALIAELANRFFAALPGQASVPTPTPPAPPVLSPAPPIQSGALAASVPATPTFTPNSLTLPSAALPPNPPTTPTGAPMAGVGQAAPLPALPLSPANVADLSGVSTAFGGVMALVQSVPITPATPTVASAHQAAGNLYFVEDKFGVNKAVAAPFHFETLLFPPESVSYNPGQIPDLHFAPQPFDPNAIRRDFPILQEQVHGKRLVWLDNAATTQKPRAVIERLKYYYEHENSNVHRAAHTLAARATDAYESARQKVSRFLNAASPQEIIFVRGTTEAINLIAQSWGRQNIGQGDEIVITWLEHHANIVPWQQLVAEKGACLRVVPVDESGQVILSEYEKLLGPRTKLVAMTQVSNALGTITPTAAMIAAAHRHGACTLVDGAQAISHMRQDVQALDTDFYVFSGHKIFGPTGIGAVYGKKALLEQTQPWQGGGNMIADVTFERTLYQPPPTRFEAGTGNIADAVGLGAALDYVSSLGMEAISHYEHELLHYATGKLRTVPGLKIIGNAQAKAGVLSFVIAGLRTEEIGSALDKEGIAVRSGHHCAQPILRRFGVESTVRASLAPYNTCEDIDALVAALLKLQRTHGR